MKIFKIILITLFVLITVGIIGAFIFLKTFDINRFKPQIISRASAALGRSVDFKDMNLELSLSRGVSLALKQLTIRDDATFQRGDFLTVESISLGLEIMPLLTKRQILVSNIHIDSAHCIIIRGKNGRINVESLARAGVSGKSRDAQRKKTALVSRAAVGLPLIFAETIAVENGKLTYIDRSREPELVLDVSQIEFRVDGFSLTDPFSFLIQGSVFSGEENVRLEGQVRVNAKRRKVSLRDIEMMLDFSDMSLQEIGETLALPEDAPLPDTLNATLEASVKELVLGPRGITPRSVPVIFTLQAAYLSQRPNIMLEGSATVNMKTRRVKFKDTRMSTDLSLLSLSQLESSLAMLKGKELPEQVKGSLKANIEQMELGPGGVLSLISRGQLTGGLIKYRQLSLPLEYIHSEFQITESKIEIKELALALGKGRLTAEAELADYLGRQDFNLALNIQYLDLAELVKQRQQKIKMEGLLLGNFKAKGRGFSPDALRNSLLGEGILEIKEGRLRDINVLKIVLNKISIFPQLVAEFEAALPDRYKRKLTQKDTILTRANTGLVVRNNSAYLEPIEIEADGFVFSGKGEVNLKQQFSLDGSFFIPEDLAASMVEIVPELGALLDEKGEIRVPLQVRGKPGEIKFTVDLAYIGEKLLKQKAEERFDKILDKIFKKKPLPPETADPDTTETPEEKKRPIERELINDILDRIFK